MQQLQVILRINTRILWAMKKWKSVSFKLQNIFRHFGNIFYILFIFICETKSVLVIESYVCVSIKISDIYLAIQTLPTYRLVLERTIIYFVPHLSIYAMKTRLCLNYLLYYCFYLCLIVTYMYKIRFTLYVNFEFIYFLLQNIVCVVADRGGYAAEGARGAQQHKTRVSP